MQIDPNSNPWFTPSAAPQGTSELDHLNKGLYAYVNAAHDPELKKQADTIFGRTVPFDNSETQATLIGRSWCSRSGYLADPVRYCRDNKLPLPPNWSGENAQLYTLIGQNYIGKAQEHFNNQKAAREKALADAQKDYTETMGELPSLLAKSIRSAGGEKGTPLTPQYLEKLTKYGAREGAIQSQQRAATAWMYMSAYMDDIDSMQSTGRDKLLDIANTLSDDKGQLDPHATAAFLMMMEDKATELQSTGSQFWADFADKFQNFLSRTEDQIGKAYTNKGKGWNSSIINPSFIVSTNPELDPNWLASQDNEPDPTYNDPRVEQLYGYMQRAINTAIAPSEKAEWYAKLLSEMGGLVGESAIPMALGIAASAATAGAGAGAFLAATAGYGAGFAATAPSTINASIAEAYAQGKVNPELYGTLEGIGQAAAENIGGPATSLKLFTKTAGKLTNWAASRTAGSRFLANEYARTTINYLTAGAFESLTELGEEELGGYIGSRLNALAREMGATVSPQAYKLGETLSNMKAHEVAAIFGYSYALGLWGIPANYRSARTFAQNTDNLLKAGHTPATARDIQHRAFQTEDKIADIAANPNLSPEKKAEAIRKEEQDFCVYQQNKFNNEILSDPNLRSRLQKEGRDIRDEAEVALDVEHEADLQILKDNGILQAVIIPGQKYQVAFLEEGETKEDGTRAPGKLITQEWSRTQLTNWLMLQKNTRIEQDLRSFNSLLLAHAHAQSATPEETKTHFQNLGANRPLAALGELHKRGITPDFFRKAAEHALALQTQHENAGMSPQEAAQQPHPDFAGLSLGEVRNLSTDAATRKEQELATTGQLQSINATTNIEYGALNILRRDGTGLIKYVAGKANLLDILEERFEIDIKQRTRGNKQLADQLAQTLLHIQSHLPGNIRLLDPAKKDRYTQSDFVEAYSKIAIGNFLLNQQNLPINPAGHRLVQNIARAVDTTRMFQTIGNAWLAYANSPEGKAHLEESGHSIADIMREAGFTFSNQIAQARATADQRTEVLQASNWQPAIEEELDALLEDIEAEEQLSELNQQEAKEPTTIPAEESITGQEITVEPTSEQETLVSPDDTPESHLRNIITQGKATIRDFADFFKDHDITEAQATELGIRPIGQNGEPTYTYRMGLRLGLGMRFGTYTSEEQIQNFIIGALVDERVREIAGEDTTSYKLERKAEAVRKNARIFRDTASASRAKYNQAKAAGGSLPMPEAPQWPAPKKKADNSQDNIVNILAPMTSKDKYRDFLTVIHKETKDGITSYVATDGTRLSMLSRKASAKEDSHIVINPKTKEEDNAENYATLHWRQVIPTKADIETTIDLAPMLALKNFRKKGGTKAGFRLTSAGTTHRSVIIKAEDHAVFVDAVCFREAVEQLANLSKTLGFPSTVKLSLLKEDGPITLSASHNGWEWKALIMPLRKANESAGDIILSEKPTILASVEKHSEDYIEKLRQDAEYDEAKAQEFEDEATNLEEQARMLASIEAQLPENDRLARWVASYFERPRMSAIFDVIKTIRSGDVQKFMPWLTNPENNLIRKLYEKISGTKLPKNTDDYKAAVDKWVSTLHSTEESPATFSIKPITAEQAESANLFTDGVLEAENAVVTKPDVNFSIKAMHASPHNFRKFSTDFMGSGEGAQAYGWGLYFMTDEGINKHYFVKFNEDKRGNLSRLHLDVRRVFKGEALQHVKTDLAKHSLDEYAYLILAMDSQYRAIPRAIETIKNKIQKAISASQESLEKYESRLSFAESEKDIERYKHWIENDKQEISDYEAILAAAEKALDYYTERTTQRYAINYRVELNADDSNLLMWDEPISEELMQWIKKLADFEWSSPSSYSKKLSKESFDRLWNLHQEQGRTFTGQTLYSFLSEILRGDTEGDAKPKAKKAASELLAKRGYKGIKYLDGNSRSAGEGTYNYVIFSGDDIKITAVNESGVWSMDEGWEEYNDPTATFSIKPAAADNLYDRFTVDPLGERIIHHIRTESRRYARILGDKTPYEQAVNAAQSAASIISAVDKYLHTPGKPVPARYRRQLQKLRSIAEKYAQIIASGTPRSFKKISPQEKQELEAAIAELEAQELDTATTESDQLLTDSDRLTKREAAARAREHHRAIVRSAAKGRVYQTLSSMLETTADALDSYLKHQLLQKLDRLTATVKIKRSPSKRLQGKMTAPAYRELERAINNMALSDRAYQDEIENVITAHETLALAINQGNTNLTSGNALLIQLADQLTTSGQQVTPQTLTAALANHEAALKIYGNVSSKNYEQTRLMANALFYLIRNGRNQWKAKHEAREAFIQQYLQHFLSHTPATSGTEQTARLAKEKEQKGTGFTRFANSMMNSTQLFHALSGIEALAPLMEHTKQALATAGVARDLHMKQMVEQVQAAYGRILGIKPATTAGYSQRQLKEISAKLDKFYEQNNQVEQTNITRHYLDADGNHQTEQLKLTKWQALDLILTYRQQHYRPNAQEHGYTDELLAQLENWCGEDLLTLGNAMQQSIPNDGTIPVYEEREGIPLRDNPLYWPAHLNIAEQETPDHPAISNPYHAAGSYRFLKGRTSNLREVAARNAYNVWKSAIAERANYVYLAPITDTLNSLLARKEFAARLKTLIGPSLYEQLKLTLKEIDGTTWAETSLQEDPHGAIARTLRNMAPALLAGNPTTLIKQSSAIANATLMPDFPPHEFAKQLIKLQQNQSGITIGQILRLDTFKARVRDNSALNDMLALGTDAKYSTYANLARSWMGLIDATDTFFNAIGATLYYNHKYEQYTKENQENGSPLTQAEIHAKCETDIAVMLALTAQPLKRTDKSAFFWRNSKTLLGPLYLYMGSEMINKVGMARANWLKRKAQGMGAAQNTLNWMYQLGAGVGGVAFLTSIACAILTGNTPDDDDSLSAWLIATYLHSAFGQYTSQMPVIGQIIDLALSPYAQFIDGVADFPGVKTATAAKKLGTMITDDKTYSGAEWQTQINRLARDLNGITGYWGGVNSQTRWLTVTSSILQTFTAASNWITPIAKGATHDAFFADWLPDWYTQTDTRSPRRPKSLIEQWLTPDTEESPRRARRRSTARRTTPRKRKRQEE